MLDKGLEIGIVVTEGEGVTDPRGFSEGRGDIIDSVGDDDSN